MQKEFKHPLESYTEQWLFKSHKKNQFFVTKEGEIIRHNKVLTCKDTQKSNTNKLLNRDKVVKELTYSIENQKRYVVFNIYVLPSNFLLLFSFYVKNVTYSHTISKLFQRATSFFFPCFYRSFMTQI